MGLLDFLVSRASRTQVNALVGEFSLACPPPDKAFKPITSQIAERALNALCLETGKLVQEQRLGVLRRAALAKSVQSELIGLGYPVDMVTKIVNALTVTALVGKPQQSTPMTK